MYGVAGSDVETNIIIMLESVFVCIWKIIRNNYMEEIMNNKHLNF